MKKIILILAILLLIIGVMQAQQTTLPLFDVRNEKFQTSMETFYQKRSITRTNLTQILEKELEASNYIIGPGDQFSIHIFDQMETEFSLTVTPEGNLVIPTVGERQIGGLTLKQAKKKVLDKIKINYLKNRIAVNLVGLRKFRVYLTGAVKNPGTYFVQGVDRLADVITASGGQGVKASGGMTGIAISGLKDWADNTRIELRHLDGKKDRIDLSKFYMLSDKSCNPYLKEGDVIYVPPIDLMKNFIIIEGNVGQQGIYPLKKDETLFSFLVRISAINKKSNLKHIILNRGGEKQIIDLLRDREKYQNFKLQSADRIIVPSIYDKVYVRGEVAVPGSLPYLADYKARDYVGRAGALDAGVSEQGIVTIRKSSGKVLKGPDVIVEKGDTVILPKRTREVFKDYMTILTPIISIIIATIALVKK